MIQRTIRREMSLSELCKSSPYIQKKRKIKEPQFSNFALVVASTLEWLLKMTDFGGKFRVVLVRGPNRCEEIGTHGDMASTEVSSCFKESKKENLS